MPLSQSIIEKAAEVLQEWGNEATFEMQRLLKARLKQNSQVSDLAQSIDFTGSEVTTNGATAIWNLNDYWVYVDLGVKGVNNRAKTYGNFKFKNVHVSKGFLQSMKLYVARKGIQLMIKDKKVTLEQKAFQMAKAVKKKGIDGTRFYSDVFNDKGFKKLTDRLETALGQEIEIKIITELKNI